MLEMLIPDMRAESIYEIDVDKLYENGIRGLILDIDNTLVGHNSQDIGENLISWVNGLRQLGMKIKLVSNNHEGRVKTFSDAIGIPSRHSANKPFQGAYIEAAKEMELEASQIAVIGDQIYTDIWGGNRCQMTTILVEPVKRSESIFFKFKRIFERPVLRAFDKRNSER